jgi:hypothetical protein
VRIGALRRYKVTPAANAARAGLKTCRSLTITYIKEGRTV